MNETTLLAALILVAAVLYSSVGHGGASGYLAAMALVGIAPEVMRPTALVLNVIVASLAVVRFGRAGSFSWPILWPFLVGSIPLAFVGGAIHVPGWLYRPVVALVLVLAAVYLVSPCAKQGRMSQS